MPDIQGIKIYYGPGEETSEGYGIVPAPQINISYEPIYTNDSVIGVTTKMTLNGMISSFVAEKEFNFQAANMLSTEDEEASVLSEDDKIIIPNLGNGIADEGDWRITNEEDEKENNIRLITNKINQIKKLLSINGYNLNITDNNEQIIIQGVGGILKSLSFENGTNNAWTHTAPFSAEIEFNYISFFGENLSCFAQMSGDIIDLSQYAIKSFSDGWSFNVTGDSFSYIPSPVNINNSLIELSYNISATGKDYYDKDSIDDRKLKPAWETAKHFVQNRLYDEVTKILSKTLPISNGDGCSSYENKSNASGIISQLTEYYQIFNETINCSFSETEGAFSATYSSILKKKSNNPSFDSDSTRHTVNKNITYRQEDQTYTTSINGNIEGLILGGLINYSKAGFTLPNNGSLLVKAYSGASKYTNALNLWNTIGGANGITDEFKDALGVVYVNGCNIATQFSVVKNIIDGTIEYNTEFTNKSILTNQQKTETIKSVVIDYTDSTPVFAEFSTLNGVVLQDINTKTNKEISFSITGRNDAYKISTSFTTFPASFIITTANRAISIPPLIANDFPDYIGEGYILKNRSQNVNMIDGTYSMQIAYSCPTGCTIS